jgi:hypothetical protein
VTVRKRGSLSALVAAALRAYLDDAHDQRRRSSRKKR